MWLCSLMKRWHVTSVICHVCWNNQSLTVAEEEPQSLQYHHGCQNTARGRQSIKSKK